MDGGASGLWAFAVVIGPILLGLIMVAGLWQWRSRNRRLDPIRDDATKRGYDAAEREAKAEGER